MEKGKYLHEALFFSLKSEGTRLDQPSQLQPLYDPVIL